MAYGIKVLLEGTDITDKVSRLEITSRLDAYCRELSLEIADEDLYDTISFGVLPTEPTLDVQTRIDTDWVSQGLFFIEKPTYQVGIHATTTGLWGRSKTALLGPPFAVKINKTWETDTSFFLICTELCTAVGLTWDAAYSDIADFTIHGRTFQAELKYPVEVLKELLQLAYGEDANLTTDAAGHVCIRLADRSPAAPDHTVTDPVTVSISEEPEWPDFGNRIRISSSGSLSGYSVKIVTPTSCLSADTETRVKLYAQVTDTDGAPVQNVPVTWSAANDYVTFDAVVTNTQTQLFVDEQVRAKSFYEVELQLPPSTVLGVFAYRDFARSDDITLDGYTIDGNVVRLTRKLNYCDQMLLVTYMADGIAVNFITAGDTLGTEKISADVAGNTATQEIYLNNPCNCPASLTLQADPSSIQVGESAGLIAYVEIGGAPVQDGRSIWMTLDSTPPHGHIDWTKATLGKVAILNEEVQAQNVIAGVSQCEISMFPDSVTGVYATREDDDGNLVKDGGSIYASHNQKVINLTGEVLTGERLLVDYVAVGAVSNIFDGISPGTDIVRAIILTSREEPTEARVSISVSAEDGDDGDPDGCCVDGLCETEAISCDGDPIPCETGEVWCARSGVYGCHPASECDVCDTGKITCTKAREAGCFASNECDTDHLDETAGKKYGKKGGVDGCWAPEELDWCGMNLVRCYKDGVLTCVASDECDSAYGGKTEECGTGKVCCEHKATKQKGCYFESECSSDWDDKKNDGHDDHDKQDHPKCKKSDGSVVSCLSGKTCCEKGGTRDCHDQSECDGSGPGCSTTPCQDDPNDSCVAQRFGGAIAKGCSCAELCEGEFSKFGTIQGYDGGSYRTIEQIVEQDHGLTADTPAYWEMYADLKQEALDQCLNACGACSEAPELLLTGPDNTTSPGAVQYVATGGFLPYVWDVTGTGATIDQTGMVTLSGGACGSFTVTVTDACGITASISARITNHGQWVQTEYCKACGGAYWQQCQYEQISGDTKIFAGFMPDWWCPREQDPGYMCCSQFSIGNANCAWGPADGDPCEKFQEGNYGISGTGRTYKWQC